MNIKRTIHWKLFLVPLFAMLLSVVTGGCSDDKDELQDKQYGYVQFKLYKSASYGQDAASPNNNGDTRSTNALDRLSDAQKIRIEMQYNGTSITQTLVLNSFNDTNAEYGIRSDKLQLLVGNYKIVSYDLLDKLDKVILTMLADEDFNIASRSMTVKDLTVDTQERGSVFFKLTKDGLPQTRAKGTYLFENIRLMDVTVSNTFTRETTEIKRLKVIYKEESKEQVNPDNADDKYMDFGTAKTDSAVWLPAGNYKVISYTVYEKNGALVSELETQAVSGEEFTVADNQVTREAIVPIKLSETAEYIKDYKALREIWQALDGKHWKYHGIGTAEGANWNFNKEMDMWGKQPGVTLNDEGRVVGLSLEGFGANGRVPDAIGQLTELKILALGSHNETITGRLFGNEAFATGFDRNALKRTHYKELFLDEDVRTGLSEMIQESINRDPKEKKIKKSSGLTPRDTQIGSCTNNITFVSKAIMRLTKLQLLYIANSPFAADAVCEDWENPGSSYAQQYKNETLSWSNLKTLTDMEVYNCPNIRTLPAFIAKLPELQLLNIACNGGISAKQLRDDWTALANAPVGKKLQIIYLGYNRLEEFPDASALQNMVKLGFLECTFNRINKVHPFGSEVKLSDLNLSYNEIEEIPEDFCGFTDQVESLNFSHNKLKYIPNIFDASSIYVMGGVDFSYNEIGSEGGKNVVSEAAYKGVNASSISLANNQITKFPTELFAAGSPLTSINLSGNLMKEIPEYSLRGKDGAYKNTYLLASIDLRFNKLTKLSDDFRSTTLPYLSNMDVSYNSFAKFPTEPLNSSNLKAFGIRFQRNDKGDRTLREWPEGITKCPSLSQLQIGSNDIRKVVEPMTPNLFILDIKDNPNISIDLTQVCSYIIEGRYMLSYDKTQDIRGCDILKR